MKGKHFAAVLAIAAATLTGNSTQAEVVKGGQRIQKEATGTRDHRPSGKGWGVPDNNGPTAKAKNRTTNGINYHGGPLILGTTNVYYIWYGDWSSDTSGQSILTDFASNIGGSSYYNINTTYYDGSNRKVSNSVHYGISASDSYSQGSSLSDAGVQAVVSSAISSGKLPKDSNAVYFVLTSKDVKETSGFLHEVLRLAYARDDLGYRYQVCVRRQPGAAVPKLMRGTDFQQPQWRSRGGRHGQCYSA